jgi:hypothetical protein
MSVILHAEAGDIEADQIALIPWATKETNHGAVFGRWPYASHRHQGLEMTLAGSDRLRAPVAVWAGAYTPL